MSKIAIRAENISKQYRLGEIGTGTISHDLNRWWHKVRGKEDPFLRIGESNDRTQKGESDYVWSLKNINFEINQGDAVGIIGRNGAGKSTLLKLLSKVTKPTTGLFKVNGRIASLLEVGTGFHPEMTGRENIYLNGAILGMRRSEITSKFDEIVDFAGIERYIDTPVKRYSSGMYVRLAFAVAAHLESEILIVDEVLAVGDAEFQKKCLGKMGDVSKGEGRTVLFVSHQMSSIEKLCNKVLVLKNGSVENFSNDTKIGISNYLGNNKLTSNFYCASNKNIDQFKLIKFYVGDNVGNVLSTPQKSTFEKYIYIEFIILQLDPALEIGCWIFDANNNHLFISQHTDLNFSDWPKLNLGLNKLRMKIPNSYFNEGIYRVQLAVSIYRQYWIIDPETSDIAINFEISGGLSNSPFWNGSRSGILAPILDWQVYK